MPQPDRRRRTVLFLPASNKRALEKARTLDCDAVILDLEDAVAPDQKSFARDQAAAAVHEAGFGPRELIVRINDPATNPGHADLSAIAEAGPDAILVPKVSDPKEFAVLVESVSRYEGVAVWAMIETATAILNLRELAALAQTLPLTAFVFGANDLARELGFMSGENNPTIDAARAQTVLAARANGVDPIDAVFNDIADTEGFAVSAAKAVRYGFAGKSLIHPSQITPCRAAYRPAQKEIDWAGAVIAAFDAPENAQLSAIKVDGGMVERLHIDIARNILANAET